MTQNQCPQCAMSVQENEEFCSFCGARLEHRGKTKTLTFGEFARLIGAVCLAVVALGFGSVGACLLMESEWRGGIAPSILIGLLFFIVAAAFFNCCLILFRWK